MSVRDTAYFQEFLDFAYLWMRDNGKDVPANYRPTPENEELWEQLNQALPKPLFELCPMHLLGRLVDRAERAEPFVLSISLNPGSNRAAEELETTHEIFEEFGLEGATLLHRCANYFQTVGIHGSFWHKIARVGRQVFIEEEFDNGMTADWMDRCGSHVDHWPLRQGAFGPFIANHEDFPVGFQGHMRQEMLIELIHTTDADLTLLLGLDADLGIPIVELPPLPDTILLNPINGEPIQQRADVYKVSDIPRCYRIPHPNAHGMWNIQRDNIATRIRIDLG
jgi:hypothetical protein